MKQYFFGPQQEFPNPRKWELVSKASHQCGIQVDILQPRDGPYLLKLTKAAQQTYRQLFSLTPNSYSSTMLANDKLNTYLILQDAGFDVPPGFGYFKPDGLGFDFAATRGIKQAETEALCLGMDWKHGEAGAYLSLHALRSLTSQNHFPEIDTLRFRHPLIVKPNSGSGGQGVRRVDFYDELEDAVGAALRTPDSNMWLLQRYLPGAEYRAIVLDAKVLICYEKRRPYVVGDGHSEVAALLAAKNIQMSKADPAIETVDLRSRDFEAILRRENLQPWAVLEEGRRLTIDDRANLERGGDVRLVDELHPEKEKSLIRIASSVGLRFAGIDFICGQLAEPETEISVLEVNANPGLWHFYKKGYEELAIAIYSALLASIFD